MRERPVTNPAPTPATFINAQNAITGLRGRDLLSTLRTVAAHGLRNPVHTARHALALGGQLGLLDGVGFAEVADFVAAGLKLRLQAGLGQ